jgi:hypothetical protein
VAESLNDNDDRNGFAYCGVLCEIRVQGRLEGSTWARWFDGMQVSTQGAETVIRGLVADQAALYGLISRVRDLGLLLRELRVVER